MMKMACLKKGLQLINISCFDDWKWFHNIVIQENMVIETCKNSMIAIILIKSTEQTELMKTS